MRIFFSIPVILLIINGCASNLPEIVSMEPEWYTTPPYSTSRIYGRGESHRIEEVAIAHALYDIASTIGRNNVTTSELTMYGENNIIQTTVKDTFGNIVISGLSHSEVRGGLGFETFYSFRHEINITINDTMCERHIELLYIEEERKDYYPKFEESLLLKEIDGCYGADSMYESLIRNGFHLENREKVDEMIEGKLAELAGQRHYVLLSYNIE